MGFKRIALAISIFVLTAGPLLSQEYNGISGLLHVPNAETDSAGTFRGAVTFLDKRFTPSQLNRDGQKYNTMGYTIGLSAFPWLEISYSAALLYMHRNARESEPLGYYNEDRRVNVKLRPLKEGKWWPAIAVGWDDIGRIKRAATHKNTNNYFQNIYVAASKHFDIKGFELAAHIAYRYYPSDANADRRGVAGGVTFVPRLGKSLQGPRAWLQRPRLIVEWDGIGVNVGADVLLWRHLFVQAALIHGSGFTGGLGYHYRIKY